MAAGDFLTQDLGPLPVWGWGVVVAGGIGAGLYLRNVFDGTGPVALDDPVAAAFQPFGGVGGVGGGGIVGGGAANVTPTVADSNEAWRQRAFQAATAAGITAVAAEQAIGGYLAGRELSADEASILERVLQTTGLPPNPPTILPRSAPPAPDPDPGPVPDPIPEPSEVPSSPEPGPSTDTPAPSTPVPEPTGGTYVVRPGDTLSGIAQATYGDGALWPTIFDANRDIISDPDLIFPGQVLRIPSAPGASAATSTAPTTGASSAPAPAPAPTPAPSSATRTHVVVSGDTLSGIAQGFPGVSWTDIFNANRDIISDPNLIFPGQVLTIPN